MKLLLTAALVVVLCLGLAGCSTPPPPPPPESNVFEVIGEQDIGTARQHMAAGTDLASFVPTGVARGGASTLHLAAVVNNENIAQMLLDKGIDINVSAKGQPGGTPLQWAAFWGVVDMTRFLLEGGADVNAKDNNGCTALCATLVASPWMEDVD